MFTLNVPQAGKSALQHTVETRPKPTMEWLARLPFANPVEAARQLSMALFTLNRHVLNEDERGALLTLYRPVVARAASSLETLVADAGVPPQPQQQLAGTLLRELLTEHSYGYKHVLLALMTPRFGRNPTKRIAEVTAHLLAALRDLQFACHLTYVTPPEGLWLETHRLYQLATTHGLADKALEDALPAQLVYCQTLLLALADPPHMSRAELAYTRLYLDKFGDLARLTTPPPDPAQNGFVIATEIDRGPGQHPPVPKDSNLWLDTDALSRHLHETAARLRSGDTPRRIGLPAGMESELSQTLSKRLLKLWRPGAQRTFKRYPALGSAVQVVAGISAIHRLLELVPQAAELTVSPDETLPIGDVASVFAAPTAVNASHWTLTNDSAAGLALTGTPDTPLNLKVGDALVLRSDDSAVWSLAVIRWIKMLDTRQVELGVERLAPSIQPVWVRPLRGRRKASPEPGLFVPGLPALHQPDRLLLPSHVYEICMDAEVWHTPRQYTVTFGRCFEHTTNYDLVDFTLLPDVSHHD